MAFGVLAMVSGDAGAAYRSPAWTIAMSIAAIAALSAGSGWVLFEGRRVGRVQLRWLVEHPDGPALRCDDQSACRYFAKVVHPEGHSAFCAEHA